MRTFLFIAILLATPLAAAQDPFQPVCEGSACVGFNGCVPLDVPGVPGLGACVPPACYPLAQCRGQVSDGAAFCAVNATIDGRTCDTTFGVGFETEGVDVPRLGPVEGSRAWVGFGVTNGSVQQFNLQNAWTAPTAEVDASVMGVDLGRTTVGVYFTEIQTEGPRGGPYGAVAPSQSHTWTQVSIVAHNSGGMGGSEDVQVSVWFLDYMPDGCHVRSPSGEGPEAACPPLRDFFALP